MNTTLHGKNAVIYVDYKNILELLKKYGKDPLEIDFFRMLQAKLTETGLKILDIIVYGNFENKSVNRNTKQQTLLRTMGFQTRHVSCNGKNSGDLELTVEVMNALYENSAIDVFIIVSSDRDFIPLLKAVQYKGKLSYVISTRTGFNSIVIQYADLHEYIEDILKLTPILLLNNKIPVNFIINPVNISPEQINRAREVARCLYNSKIWLRASITQSLVNLKGYLSVVVKVVNREPEEVLNDFKMAHYLKYLTIYQDPERGLCIKEGDRKNEAFVFNKKIDL